MRLEEYTKIKLEDDVELWIRNKLIASYQTSPSGKIVCEETSEEFNQVFIYRQELDEDGNKLETPIDGMDDYYYVFPNGNKIKCSDLTKKID